MLKPNSSSNTPKFIAPHFETSEIFARYCYLYDPLVSIGSAIVFEYFSLEILRRWHWNGFIHLKNNCAKKSKLTYYYSCVAPYIERITGDRAVKLVEENISSRKSANKRFNAEKSLEALSRNLNQSSLIKQYIFYECEDKKGWMIILRTEDTNNEPEYPTIGIGSTLQDAGIDFAKNQSQEFIFQHSSINFFLNKEIPLTPQDMFVYCSKFDPEVALSSSRFIRPYKYLTSTIPDSYSLKCQSSQTVFLMEVECKHIEWKVKKILKLENDSPLIGDELPVEVSHSKLQEAFRLCEEEISRLQNNPQALTQAIRNLEQQTLEEEEEMQYDYREGQTFVDSMISGYGEDVFPDR